MPPTHQPKELPQSSPIRATAACLALTGFSIAIATGIAADVGTNMILTRALYAMLGCFVVGLAAGWVLHAAFRDSIEQHLRDHPVVDSEISIDEIVAQHEAEETANDEQSTQVIPSDTVDE